MNARILLILVALTLLSVAGAVFLLQSDEPSQSTSSGAVVIVDDEDGLTTTLPAHSEGGDRRAMEGSAGPLPDGGSGAKTLVADQLAAVIQGRVISRSGQPRVGATVEAYTQDSEGFQYQLKPSGSTTETDGSGEFALVGVPSSQPLMLEVQADNAAPLYVEVGGVAPGETRHLGDLLVSSGTTLVGLITDETGRPLPNATIEVFDTGAQGDGPNGSRPIASAVSDGSGEYKIDYLAQRQYSIHAGLDGYTPMTSVLAFVLGGAGPEWRQNFTLWRADKIIAGRVIAADGSGLPEIEMRLVKRQKGGLNTYFTVVGQTDDRGEFRFDEVPEGLFDVTLNGAQWYIDGPLRLEAPRTDHEIIMHPSLTVNGQLTTSGELPEQFTVTVKPDGRTGARLLQGGSATRTFSETAPPGSFVFPGLRPGAYSFLVKAPGFAIARSQDVIMGSAQFSADVVIPLFQGASLEGRVGFAGSASENAAKGRIELRGAEWDPGLAIESAFPTPPLHGLVKALDGDSHFALQNIPEGSYVVTIRADGAPPLHLHEVTLAEGQQLDLGFIEVTMGGQLSGRVLGMDGRPASGATVRLSGTGFHSEVSTRADGTFLASRLPAGRYDIDVSPAGIFEAFRQHAVGQVVVDAEKESSIELMLTERVTRTR